jgi:hypothetical protein
LLRRRFAEVNHYGIFFVSLLCCLQSVAEPVQRAVSVSEKDMFRGHEGDVAHPIANSIVAMSKPRAVGSHMAERRLHKKCEEREAGRHNGARLKEQI